MWVLCCFLTRIQNNCETSNPTTNPKPFLFFQVSEAGVHRPHVGGIHGRSNDGSYSLVLAGGFEDEVVCVCVCVLRYLTFLTFELVANDVSVFLGSGQRRWVHIHRQRGSWPFRKQKDRRALVRPDPDAHEQVWTGLNRSDFDTCAIDYLRCTLT